MVRVVACTAIFVLVLFFTFPLPEGCLPLLIPSRIIWQSPGFGRNTHPSWVLPISDLTNDSVAELLVCIDAVRADCINGSSGAILWSFTDAGDPLLTAVAVPDQTGDNVSEVLIVSQTTTYVVDGAQGLTLSASALPVPVTAATTVSDVNGGGYADAVLGLENATLALLTAEEQQLSCLAQTPALIRVLCGVADNTVVVGLEATDASQTLLCAYTIRTNLAELRWSALLSAVSYTHLTLPTTERV